MGTDLCAAVTEALYCQELHGVVPDTEGAHETHEPGEMTELGDHQRRRLLLGASAERKIGRRSLSRLPALGALSLAPLAITPAVLRGSVGQGPVGSQGEPYHTPYTRIHRPRRKLMACRHSSIQSEPTGDHPGFPLHFRPLNPQIT